MTAAPRLLLAVALILACLLNRQLLERDPVTHVLVQLPLLIAAGWQVGRAFAENVTWRSSDWNRGGLPLLILAVFTLAYWMLPRAIDGALTDPWQEALKFVSLPLLVGLPLAFAWPRAHGLVRGFLQAHAVSMLGVLAFLYTHAPIRICNAYLIDDQVRLGVGFLCAALGLAALWCVPLFLGRGSDLAAASLRKGAVGA